MCETDIEVYLTPNNISSDNGLLGSDILCTEFIAYELEMIGS